MVASPDGPAGAVGPLRAQVMPGRDRYAILGGDRGLDPPRLLCVGWGALRIEAVTCSEEVARDPACRNLAGETPVARDGSRTASAVLARSSSPSSRSEQEYNA